MDGQLNVSMVKFCFWGDQTYHLGSYQPEEKEIFVQEIVEVFQSIADCFVWSITEGCLVIKVIPNDSPGPIAGSSGPYSNMEKLHSSLVKGHLLTLINKKMEQLKRSPYDALSHTITSERVDTAQYKRKKFRRFEEILHLEAQHLLQPFNVEYDMIPINGFVGKAYIFNNEHFSKPYVYNQRKGSEVDVLSLTKTFEGMRLKPVLHLNLTVYQLEQVVRDICQKHVSADDKCVVVAIMSHGTESRVRMYDDDVELKRIFKPFAESIALENKPKIFFIQACQGGQFNLKEVQMDGEPFAVDGIAVNNTAAPNGSDFLICYATTPGYQAFRNLDKGSWFIQKLADVFEQYFSGTSKEKLDIVQLMTAVSQRVASKEVHQDVESEGKWYKLKLKQMPSFVSMLRKRVFFERRVAEAAGDLEEYPT